METRLRKRLLVAGLAILALIPGSIRSGERTLEECARLVRDQPQQEEGYRCYWELSRAGQRAEVIRALEALLAVDPGNPLTLYNLAQIECDRGNERGLDLLQEAAEAYAAEGDRIAEGRTLLALTEELRRRGRMNEAEQVLQQAARLAEELDDRVLLADVWANQGRFLMLRGDYGAALRHLNQAEREIFPDGPLSQRMQVLSDLAWVYVRLGRQQEALECYRRKVAMPDNLKEGFQAAYDQYMIARLSGALYLPSGKMTHEEYVRSLEESIEIAVRVGHRNLEAAIRRALGRKIQGPESVRQLTLAREIAISQGQARTVRAATRSLAEAILREYPDRRAEAFDLMEEALEATREAGDPTEMASMILGKAEFLSQAGDVDGWRKTSLEALDAIEHLLGRQPESGTRTRTLSRWAHAYLRLSGRLLAMLDESNDPAGDIELAFRTIERMRSRVLIQELDMAGIDIPADTAEDLERRRIGVRNEITRIQRRLADPELTGENRTAALAELDRYELEITSLLDALARVSGGSDPSTASLLPDIRAIQERLAPDQALLSFQLSRGRKPPVHLIDNGGSWLLLITSRDAVPLPLQDMDIVSKQVRMMLGLCRRGDGTESEASEVLYSGLLEEALKVAGPDVNRLVIVADHSLHRLPFAALRPGPDGRCLGERYEITRAPSCTLWLRQKAAPERTAPAAALAMADPDLLGVTAGDSVRIADPWVEGLRLGPLPLARKEAKEVVRRIGGSSRVVVGPEATERFLKQADLGGYDILHFATHAVVDYDHPERSAILLGPGSENEDGFLQVREISELDLEGKVVILSACRSASGEVLRGEGMLGVGRAFFQAGSRAVIGNLWPMRDADAEAFVDELSIHLASGKSLAGAVKSARESRIAAGAPAMAWAGVILVGDGDYIPVPGGVKTGRRTKLLVAGLMVIPLLIVVIVYLRRRGSRVAEDRRTKLPQEES